MHHKVIAHQKFAVHMLGWLNTIAVHSGLSFSLPRPKSLFYECSSLTLELKFEKYILVYELCENTENSLLMKTVQYSQWLQY